MGTETKEETTVQSLAAELSAALERRTRESGHEPGLDHYVTLKEGSPAWMTEACHAAHGDMMPDDWRYEFIEDAASALAEAEDPDDAEPFEYVYTNQVTGWLHSRVDRYSYVDQAVEDMGGNVDKEGILPLLFRGMYEEQRETLYLLRSALEELAKSRDV
jgi:hypothetical protein